MRSAWFAGSAVGISAEGAAELGSQGIDLSDQIVRDLDIPVMTQALELLDVVFAIADDLREGSAVRAAVKVIRGAEYADVLVGGMLPAGAVGAGAGVMTGIGGVAALGAIAVVGVVLFSILGGGADDTAELARRKRAQAAALHLRDRLTLEGFAKEQDETAISEQALVTPATALPQVFGSAFSHAHAAEVAKKLAAFYRAIPARTTPAERALFESLSNLARWQAALNTYGGLGTAKRDAIDVLFGSSAPRLPYQLAAPMAAEAKTAAVLVRRVQVEKGASLAIWAGAAALGAGALYVYNPVLLLLALRGAGKVASLGYHAAGRLVKGVLP